MAKKIKDKIVKQETPAQRLSGIIKTCRNIMRKDKGMNGDGDRLPMLTWIMFLKFLDDNENLQETQAALKDKKYKAAIAEPYRWRDWAKDKNLTGDDLLSYINNEKVKLADGKERTGLLYYLRGLQSETGTERKDVIAAVFKGVTNRMINGYLLRDVVNKIDEIHFTNNEEINTLSHLYESILKEMRDASGDAGEFYTPRPVVKFMVEMLDPKIGETVFDPASGTGGFLVAAFEHLKKQAKTIEQQEILQNKSIIGGEAKPLPYLLCQMNLLLHGLNYPNIDSGNSLRKPLRDIGDSERVEIILTNPPFGGEEERGILNNFPDDKKTSETAFLFLQLIMRKLKRKTPSTEGGKAAIVVPKGTLFTEGVSARIMEQLLRDFEVHTVVKLAEGVFEPYTSITSYLIFFNHTGNPTKKIWYYEIIPSEQRKKYSKTKPIYYDEFNEIKKWWNKRKKSENCWTVSIDDVLQRDEKENLVVNLDFKNPNTNYEINYADPLDTADDLIEKQKSVTDEIQEIKAELDNFYSNLSEKFDLVPLSKVLKQYRVETRIEDDINYKQLTISKYEGIKQRGHKLGYDIGRKRQFLVDLVKYPNTILYTRQTLQQDEAIGLAPYEVNGCITTENMPMFSVVDSEPLYVHYFFKSNFFLKQLHKTSAKGTSQQTIHEDTFLTYLIPLPDNDIQKEVIRLLEKVIKLKEAQEEISKSLSELFPAVLQKTFSEETIQSKKELKEPIPALLDKAFKR
jgi:type I restriction enzyme M protein